MDKTLKLSILSLVFNMSYSAYHIAFGVFSRSWWLFTVGIYYAILSVIRFSVLVIRKRLWLVTRLTGVMLMFMSLPLAGTVILAVVKDRGTVFHEIVMIAIAVYAFTKITLATVNLIKARRASSVKLITLRNVSCASACVSIFALQRSMLVSFGEMAESDIRIMNIATGTGVCIVVFLLGLNLVLRKKSLPDDLRAAPKCKKE